MKLPEYIFTIYMITYKNHDFLLKYPHPINQSVINKAFSLGENALGENAFPHFPWVKMPC